MSALPCRVTADLNAYMATQDKLEVSAERHEEAITRAMHKMLAARHPMSRWTGGELVSEALNESYKTIGPRIATLMCDALSGADEIDAGNCDLLILGRDVFTCVAEYLRTMAEQGVDAELARMDDEDRECAAEARADQMRDDRAAGDA